MIPLKFKVWNGYKWDYHPTIYDGMVWNPVEDCEIKGAVAFQFTGFYDTTKWEELTSREQSYFGHLRDEWKGREIYEGDIVSCANAAYIGIIVWNQERGGFGYKFIGKKEKEVICVFKETNSKYSKVLGNTSENKDLTIYEERSLQLWKKIN